MKKLFLVLLLATTVAQAETYKWTDKEGTVHFSESLREVPADYRKNTDNSGSVAPNVEELKERMLNDEGIMALIRAIQNDPEMQTLLSDPAIISAIQAGDIGTLIINPDFMKLLNNPRVREIENRMNHGGTK